jgi:hypothetical protein
VPGTIHVQRYSPGSGLIFSGTPSVMNTCLTRSEAPRDLTPPAQTQRTTHVSAIRGSGGRGVRRKYAAAMSTRRSARQPCPAGPAIRRRVFRWRLTLAPPLGCTAKPGPSAMRRVPQDLPPGRLVDLPDHRDARRTTRSAGNPHHSMTDRALPAEPRWSKSRAPRWQAFDQPTGEVASAKARPDPG